MTITREIRKIHRQKSTFSVFSVTTIATFSCSRAWIDSSWVRSTIAAYSYQFKSVRRNIPTKRGREKKERRARRREIVKVHENGKSSEEATRVPGGRWILLRSRYLAPGRESDNQRAARPAGKSENEITSGDQTFRAGTYPPDTTPDETILYPRRRKTKVRS